MKDILDEQLDISFVKYLLRKNTEMHFTWTVIVAEVTELFFELHVKC